MPRYTVDQSALLLAPIAIAALKARKKRVPNRIYWEDPVAWVNDRIPALRGPDGLTHYQEECLTAIAERKRASGRGPHGLGKTTIGALAVAWFADTRDRAGVDWKAVTTAGSWGQLRNFLWPEIHKWVRQAKGLNWPEGSSLLQMSIKRPTGAAFAVASNRPELIEGAHADSILYIYDESKSIAEATFNASEGAFSGAVAGSGRDAYAWAGSTPGAPIGRFSDIHHHKPGLEDWYSRHVTLQEAVEAGRISMDWAIQRGKQWGVGSALYKNRVLGEFAAEDASSVIPLAWLEAANARWMDLVTPGTGPGTDLPAQLSLPAFSRVAVDVARFGDDSTVLALIYGDVLAELRTFAKEETTAITGHVVGVLRGKVGEAVVDVIGLGAGVVDQLREMRYPVRAFNASRSSNMLDRSGELGFINRRAAAWWFLREQLDPSFAPTLALPPDDNLTGDLTSPTWRTTSGSRIAIEPKDDTRKRLGRSPDHGDAAVMGFAPEEEDEYEGTVVWDDPVDIADGF